MYSIDQLSPYTVALRGAPALNSAQRIRLEVQFAAILERIYQGHVERIAEDVGCKSKALTSAIEQASYEVLRGVGESSARFEVLASSAEQIRKSS